MLVVIAKAAYGRQKELLGAYPSLEAAKADWDKGLDFQAVRVTEGKWVGGPYFSKRDAEQGLVDQVWVGVAEPGPTVWTQYLQLHPWVGDVG